MSQLHLRIFDGSRQLFLLPASFLVRIVDGNQKQQRWHDYASNDLLFPDLPFFDNQGDSYSVLVSAKGYKQAGFYPVKLSNAYVKTLDVMLVSKTPGFSFVSARWPEAQAKYPFLGSDVDNAAGEARYDDLLDRSERALACFLNLAEAMSTIPLAEGTPLTHIRQMRWDGDFRPAQDRFFSWCDATLIDQVREGASVGQFSEEPAPGLLHPGATYSWKEAKFGEANVQLTFHENEKQKIGGVDCVMLETDVDYYRDPLAHAILEVFPNGLTHALTDPVEVYVLRWMAGRMAGVPEFAPLYTVTG
ncbi:hypothetical protein [Edaphobacter aggregans]|uniref:hypothetical protein n=1 Tax=Edaphobacter aggregans TaxID=570835 RepID=UPI0005526847|nr:hypothetical protein [Edaphobacter aggregans]